MPSIASAFGCLRRIENFLLLETKRDNRLLENTELLINEASEGYELRQLRNHALHNTVISIKELSIGWTREHVVLQGISLEIPRGSVTMIIGP